MRKIFAVLILLLLGVMLAAPAFAAGIPFLTEDMTKALGNFCTSPEGLIFFLTAAVGFLKWLFEHTGLGKYRLWWEKYGGMVVHAFQMAEKAIPDTVENKTLAKIDKFLKVFCVEYTKAYSAPAPDSLLTWAKNQASILALQAKAGQSPNS